MKFKDLRVGDRIERITDSSGHWVISGAKIESLKKGPIYFSVKFDREVFGLFSLEPSETDTFFTNYTKYIENFDFNGTSSIFYVKHSFIDS